MARKTTLDPKDEGRLTETKLKLAALSHLLSQYNGELEWPDEASHGLAYLFDDIIAELEVITEGENADGTHTNEDR
jgi:hypothetical protein